jgi:hypothetical protein
MWAKPRPNARVFQVFLLCGLLIQPPSALTWDVDGDTNSERDDKRLTVYVRHTPAGAPPDLDDPDTDCSIPGLDSSACTTKWTHPPCQISKASVTNLGNDQAVPTRESLTRNGSTFDKPDGNSLGSPRSSVSLPPVKTTTSRNTAQVISRFTFDALSTHSGGNYNGTHTRCS